MFGPDLKNMMKIKKIWKFLTSMKFAIILLVILAVACALSSLIAQGESYAWYAQTYSERTAAIIMALHLDDAYHSWWFVLLSAVLCLNLIFCNLIHFPGNLERARKLQKAESYLQSKPTVTKEGIEKPEEIFKKMHFSKILEGTSPEAVRDAENGLPEETTDASVADAAKETIDGFVADAAKETTDGLEADVAKEITDGFVTEAANSLPEASSRSDRAQDLGNSSTISSKKEVKKKRILFSARNSLGIWGAWICHLGILLLLVGFALGQYTKSETAVYGLPGQTKPIGDTGLTLTIDTFEVRLREDDTVEQYTAAITVTDPKTRASQSAEISVNNPAKLFGKTFYQNSTGWAAEVLVLKDGEPLQNEELCVGEFLAVADKPELVVYFRAFYPDYVQKAGEAPRTASGLLKNPAYLYMVYYRGELLGMNTLLEGEELTIDEYMVRFAYPENYTLIQVKEDHFTWLALLGGIITMLGIFMALYLQLEKLWAVQQDDGTWTVYGYSRKGGVLFKEKFEEALPTKTPS